MADGPRETPGGPCAACGAVITRALSWSGRGEEKYCSSRPCQRVGEDKGHIVRRAAAGGSAARANGADGRDFLFDMELLKLSEIIATRIFKTGQLRGEVGFSNKVPADDRRLHLLIYGKVRLNEEDEKGRWGHWWLTAEQLQEQEAVTTDDLKDARKKYREREDALWAGDE